MRDTEVQEETESKGRKPELPGSPGVVFVEIENQVIALHSEWGIYKQLFENEGDWKLLAQSSAYGWPVLHDALVERCILRLTRLTDPATSMKSDEKTNLSFDYLVSLIEPGEQGSLLEELKATLANLKTQISPLKELRDKVLAHTDEGTAMGKRQYPVVSISLINTLLPQIADFCQKVRSHFGLIHFYYDWCVGAWAGGIVASFRKLEQFEELRDRVRNGEPLDISQLRQAILKVGHGPN